MCLDDRKLNVSIKKYQYPLPFTDQILERVDGHEFYYFFYGSSSYHQFEVDLEDQDKNLILNWEKCPFMVSFGIFLGHIVFLIISYYFTFLLLRNLHVCRKLILEAPLKSLKCSLKLFLECLFAFLQDIEVNVRFRLGGGIESSIACLLCFLPFSIEFFLTKK